VQSTKLDVMFGKVFLSAICFSEGEMGQQEVRNLGSIRQLVLIGFRLTGPHE
jgi:hypothetical protein